MRNHYPVFIEQDADGLFIVECPVFKGCRSYGDTIDEAMENIREAIEVCMEENEAHMTGGKFIGWRETEAATA